MFKIGDYAKLSRVSVKTLHHYDEFGLLKPVSVDRFTGYRYYSFEQLLKLNRILALKDLGFSLDRVKRLLEQGVSLEQMQGMLRLRQSELEEQMQVTQERLKRVEARLKMLQEEGKMADYEVILKPVEPLKIVSAREVVPDQALMRERCIALMDEVFEVLRQADLKDTGLSLALYHDNSSAGIDVEMAMVIPAASSPATKGRVQVYTLPAVPTMASTLYQGSYDAFGEVAGVYAAFASWIERNGYTIAGPSREIYLKVPKLGTGDPSGLMEIQFPVEKAR